MPYIPSKKTDGKSTDREILDAAVERLASDVVVKISNNLSLISIYKTAFIKVAESLYRIARGVKAVKSIEADLAQAIYDVSEKYDYEGAYLGALNYALSRFIQRVPQLKVQNGIWTQELRYWLYAATVEALIYASYVTRNLDIGASGVFEDIKDEYKRRVNTAYEAEQILKNGDCYDTPYYTKLVRVVDSADNVVGYAEIMLKRDQNTLAKDIFEGNIVLQN